MLDDDSHVIPEGEQSTFDAVADALGKRKSSEASKGTASTKVARVSDQNSSSSSSSARTSLQGRDHLSGDAHIPVRTHPSRQGRTTTTGDESLQGGVQPSKASSSSSSSAANKIPVLHSSVIRPVPRKSTNSSTGSLLTDNVTEKSTVETTPSGALPNRTLTQETNQLVRVTADGTFVSVPGISGEEFFDLLKADTRGWSTGCPSAITGEEWSVYRFQAGSILAGRKDPGDTYEHIIRKKLGLPPLAKATDGFAFEVKRQRDEASRKLVREQAAARKVEADILAGFEKTASSSSATSAATKSQTSAPAAAKPPADNNSSTVANAVADREERDRKYRQRCVEEWETLCQNPSWELRSRSGTWIPHYTGDGRFTGQPENGIRIALGIHQINYRTREPLKALEGSEAPHPVFLRDWDLKTGKRVNSAAASSKTLKAAPKNTSPRASLTPSENLDEWEAICKDPHGWELAQTDSGLNYGRYKGDSENILRGKLGIRKIHPRTREYLANDKEGRPASHPLFFRDWDPKTGYFAGLEAPPKEFVSSSSSSSSSKASSSSGSSRGQASAKSASQKKHDAEDTEDEGEEEQGQQEKGASVGDFDDSGGYVPPLEDEEAAEGDAVDEEVSVEALCKAFRSKLAPRLDTICYHHTGTKQDFYDEFNGGKNDLECPRRNCEGYADCPRKRIKSPSRRRVQQYCVGCTTATSVKLLCHYCQAKHIRALSENLSVAVRKEETQKKS